MNRLNRRRHILFLFLLLAAVVARDARALDLPVDILIDTTADIDQLLAESLIDADTAEILTTLLADPVDLQQASRRRLLQLPGIDESAADAIVALRRRKPVDLDLLVRTGIIAAAAVPQLEPFVTTDHATGRWRTRQETRMHLPGSPLPTFWQRAIVTTDGILQQAGLLWQLSRTTWHRVYSDGVDLRVGPAQIQPRPERYGLVVDRHPVRLVAGTWAWRPGEALTFAAGHRDTQDATLALTLRPRFDTVPDCRRLCREQVLADPVPAPARRGAVLTVRGRRAALHAFVADTIEQMPSWAIALPAGPATAVTYWMAAPGTSPVELRRALPLLSEQLAGAGWRVEIGRVRTGCLLWGARPRWRIHPAPELSSAAALPSSGIWGASGCWIRSASHRLSFGGEFASSLTSHIGAAGTIRLSGRGRIDWRALLWHYGAHWDNPHTAAPASPLRDAGVRGRGETGVRLHLRAHRRLFTTQRTEIAWHRVSSRWRIDSRTALHSHHSTLPWSVSGTLRTLMSRTAPPEWRMSPLARLGTPAKHCWFQAQWTIETPSLRQSPEAAVRCSIAHRQGVSARIRTTAQLTLPGMIQEYGLHTRIQFRRAGHVVQTGPDTRLMLDEQEPTTVDVWWTLTWDWRSQSAGSPRDALDARTVSSTSPPTPSANGSSSNSD